eukprot:Em0001g3812a
MEEQENSKTYLDIKQKVKVIKEGEQGKEVIEVARAFGVSVSQVYKILKSREVISKNNQDPTFKKDSKLIKQKGKIKPFLSGYILLEAVGFLYQFQET